jgi:hypothetical protein
MVLFLFIIKKNRKMNNRFLALVLLFILQGCLDLRPCPKKKLDIVARYYSYNNARALNWLDLKKDGTFSHYYKEDTIQLSHHGTWNQSKKNGCLIEFDSWKTFNEDGKNYQKYGNGLLWISYNYLDIGPDGESSTSFEKSSEDMSINPLDKK